MRGFVSRPLSDTATKLFPYLPLLLIPASVGVIQYGDLLEREGIAVLVALVVSLVISFIATPYIFKALVSAFNRH
ncbi:MAG: CidA/LrgA family protein, partial [Ketobacteraceae bacterium]|nr:CidA/LrgA family protein [Ketobacteraceae bacterium]